MIQDNYIEIVNATSRTCLRFRKGQELDSKVIPATKTGRISQDFLGMGKHFGMWWVDGKGVSLESWGPRGGIFIFSYKGIDIRHQFWHTYVRQVDWFRRGFNLGNDQNTIFGGDFIWCSSAVVISPLISVQEIQRPGFDCQSVLRLTW